MIKRIDRFLNWLLYSLYNMLYYSGLLIYELVALLFMRPLYRLPCWRNRLKKKGLNSFQEWKRCTIDSLYHTMDSPTSGFTLYYLSGLSLALLSMPIFLLLSLYILAFGWSTFSRFLIHPIVATALGIVPAWILSDFFFWKKDRYLGYFAIFEKKSRKKKIAWAIGVFFGLLLLIAANLFLMWYITKIHGDFKNLRVSASQI